MQLSNPVPEGAYTARRTFVLQIGPKQLDGGVGGRVEHIVTGRRGEFASLEELIAFVRHALMSDEPS